MRAVIPSPLELRISVEHIFCQAPERLQAVPCVRNGASGQAPKPQNVEFQEIFIALLRITSGGALLEICPRLCPSKAFFLEN
jgi:hypothetical protein